jgi:hypothetical protein
MASILKQRTPTNLPLSAIKKNDFRHNEEYLCTIPALRNSKTSIKINKQEEPLISFSF